MHFTASTSFSEPGRTHLDAAKASGARGLSLNQRDADILLTAYRIRVKAWQDALETRVASGVSQNDALLAALGDIWLEHALDALRQQYMDDEIAARLGSEAKANALPFPT